MKPQTSGGPCDPNVLCYYDGPVIFYEAYEGVDYLFFEAEEGLYTVMPLCPGDIEGVCYDLNHENGSEFRTIRKLLDNGGWLWSVDGEVDFSLPRVTFPEDYYPLYAKEGR